MQQGSILHANDWTRRPTVVLAAAVALLAGLLTAALGQGTASAGGVQLTISLDDPAEERYAFSGDFQGTCEADEIEVLVSEDALQENAVDVDLDEEVTLDQGAVEGTFSAAQLAADEYWLHLICDGRGVATGLFDVLRLNVDKVVEGDAPSDVTFEIAVDCQVPENGNPGDGFESLLTFGDEGGSTALGVPPGATCDVTVVDDGGAESTEVANGDALEYGSAPQEETTTITSTFPEAADEPEEEEEEDEDDDEDDDEEEEEPEAEPAEAVEDEPDYTG